MKKKLILLFGILILISGKLNVFGDFVKLNGPRNDLKMRCRYNYTLDFDLSSKGTPVSNFVELISEFSTDDFDNIQWNGWDSKVDFSNSTYSITNNSLLKNLVVWGGFLQPWNKIGSVYTVRLTLGNSYSGTYKIYGLDDKKGLKDTVSSLWYGPYEETLSGFVALPCIDDTNNPGFSNLFPQGMFNGSIRVSSKSGISLDVHDTNGEVNSAGWNTTNYTNPKTNYLKHTDLPYNSTNQYGIDINSFEMILETTGNPIYNYPNIVWNSGNLSTNWSASGFDKTWQFLDKNYHINTTNTMQEFGREKEMRLTTYVEDRLGLSRQRSWVFNSPDDPKIKDIIPDTNGEILPLTDILFTLYDNRAGIDPSSIILNIYNNKTGNNHILLGSFSSGLLSKSSLTGIADNPDQRVLFASGINYNNNQFTFPMPLKSGDGRNQIEFDVYARDFEGNDSWNNFVINTRYACEYYPGCRDNLTIYNIYNLGNTGSILYNYPELYVTGYTNFELSGNILDCGLVSGSMKTGILFISTGNLENNIYYNKKLYISGTNSVSLSGNKLTIF